MTPAAGARARGQRAAWVQVGAVLVAWAVALLAENLFVVLAFRTHFAGAWEMAGSRRWCLPIAIAGLAPLALAGTLLARLAAAQRGWAAGIAVAAGAATGWGVSYGRHMASLFVRVPFVVGLAVIAAACAWWGAPVAARAAERRPKVLALVAAVGAVAAWTADLLVLPRLYPAFHVALFALTLAAAGLMSLALRPAAGEATRAPAITAALGLLVAALCIARAPAAAKMLATSDNLRLLLVEHAPLAGRAVWLASRLAQPPPEEVADASVAPPGELPRALDWTGRDIVLVTVDALRADHVGAYGYARLTTPSLDALARDGARFDAAYCPTPHTSYSIASLMTGKYMRPLVALGLAEDSDTWAGLLRRYGYRTAAFFPPAVFFIDGERFATLHARGLDFEYRKEEFASPGLRARQVAEYLAGVPKGVPLFLWVHFFEPHEPYVAHPEHPFGDSDVDRYDSEIASADEGIGVIVRAVKAARPGAVVIATADHGEEFGEHGGRYHGTTVYEEQVRVPLIVDGPGVAPGAVASVAQTIDLLPTVLSALGIPRPARLRGRDLGPLLSGKERGDPGLAFAETDEYTLLARGDARLVCARRAAACALFDRAKDPGEAHDVAPQSPDLVLEMKRALAGVAGAHGRFEHGEEAAWPEALRRGIAGDADAAVDVAALLDDANAAVRAKAAEVSFDLHAADVAPAMRRAAASGDEPVRRWCSLALVRMGEAPGALAEGLVKDSDATWRRPAALAFAERGDARGSAELAAWWADRAGVEYVRATEILAALAKVRARAAVPALVRSLEDVRLRPFVADTLAAIGDPSALAGLAATLAVEKQVTARAHEAKALAALGGAAWTAPAAGPAPAHVEAKIAVPRGSGTLTLVVLGAGEGTCAARIDGVALEGSGDASVACAFEVSAVGPRVSVQVDAPAGVLAVALVRAPEGVAPSISNEGDGADAGPASRAP